MAGKARRNPKQGQNYIRLVAPGAEHKGWWERLVQYGYDELVKAGRKGLTRDELKAIMRRQFPYVKVSNLTPILPTLVREKRAVRAENRRRYGGSGRKQIVYVASIHWADPPAVQPDLL